MMNKHIIAFVLFCWAFLSLHDVYANCNPLDRKCNGFANSIYMQYVLLDRNVSHSFLLTNNSPSTADPVMYLIDPNTKKSICAKDSTAGGGDEEMIVNDGVTCPLPTQPGTTIGVYMLVIHGYSSTTNGTGNLAIKHGTDPTQLLGQISYNGFVWIVDVESGEKLQSAPDTFNTTSDTVLLLKDGNIPGQVHDFDDDGGVGFQSRVVNSTGSAIYYAKVVIGSYSTFTQGSVNVYRNDATDDSSTKSANCSGSQKDKDQDCDGIGDALEMSLGTCPCLPGTTNCPVTAVIGSVCAYSTANLYSPRDSDGDGLPDYWEIFGRRDPGLSIFLGDLTLGQFGVSPIHKDVLIEIDYEEITGVNPSDPDYASKTTRSPSFATINDFVTVMCRGDANTLRNPDGQPGIAVHVDSANLGPSTFPCGGTASSWGGSTSLTKEQAETAEKTSYMHLNRWGIFRYGKSVQTLQAGGAVNSDYFSFTGISQHNQQNSNDRLDMVGVWAHEFGHTLGLSHAGEFVLNTDPGPFSHPGPSQQNYKPNYPSLMNYAFKSVNALTLSQIRFSTGDLLDLNPQSLQESHGMGPIASSPEPNQYNYYLEQSMKYPVLSDGSVDWNLNGTDFAAYSSFIDAPVCDYQRDCYYSITWGRTTVDLTSEIHSKYKFVSHGLWDTPNTGVNLYAFYANVDGNLVYRKYEYSGWSSARKPRDTNNNELNIKVKSAVSSKMFLVEGNPPDERLYLAYLNDEQKPALAYVKEIDCDPNANPKPAPGCLAWNYIGVLSQEPVPNGNGQSGLPEYNQGPSLLIDTRNGFNLRFYYLTGKGFCHIAAKEEKKACTSGDDCESSQVCQNNKCETACSNNADCSNGQVCSSSICVDCVTQSDCGDGLLCQNNVCVGCAADTDCSAGRVCKENLCVDSCTNDSECGGSGKVCKNGGCRQACVENSTCSNGLQCLGKEMKVHTRTIDTQGALNSTCPNNISIDSCPLEVSGNNINSGVTPSALIHPGDNKLYLFASSLDKNKMTLLRNTSPLPGDVDKFSVVHDGQGTNSIFSIKPVSTTISSFTWYLNNVQFTWQPSVVIDNNVGHNQIVHFLFQGRYGDFGDQGMSHAKSSTFTGGTYPFVFPRRTSAGPDNRMYFRPSLFNFNNHVNALYLSQIGSKFYLEHLPYLDGLYARTIKDTNDWDVMSRYLCSSIAGSSAYSSTTVGAGLDICLEEGLTPSYTYNSSSHAELIRRKKTLETKRKILHRNNSIDCNLSGLKKVRRR